MAENSQSLKEKLEASKKYLQNADLKGANLAGAELKGALLGGADLSGANMKKIFLGDAGSMVLGFILSWFLIYYSHPTSRYIHPVLTLWCIPLPMFDLLGVIIRRLIFVYRKTGDQSKVKEYQKKLKDLDDGI